MRRDSNLIFELPKTFFLSSKKLGHIALDGKKGFLRLSLMIGAHTRDSNKKEN